MTVGMLDVYHSSMPYQPSYFSAWYMYELVSAGTGGKMEFEQVA